MIEGRIIGDLGKLQDFAFMNSRALFQILALIVFCFAIGEVVAMFMTGVIFGVSTDEVLKVASNPTGYQRDILLTFSFLSSILRFIIVPGVYLFFTDKQSLHFVRDGDRVRLAHVLLVVALFVAAMPCISVLIELNYRLWPPGNGEQLTAALFSFKGIMPLIVTIIVVAIIPGVVEEIFFRGIVQSQLADIINKKVYAIVLTAVLFSLFHFQLHGFIPRMVLGVLLGYVYVWTNNIWYPVIAHVVNNLISVLSVYFVGLEMSEPTMHNDLSKLLLIPSIIISAYLIRRLTAIRQPPADIPSRAH